MASSTRLRSPADSAVKGTTVPGSSKGWSSGNKGSSVGISSGFTGSSSSQTLCTIATASVRPRRRRVRRRREEVQGEELEEELQHLAEARRLQQGLLLGGGERRGLGQQADELAAAQRVQGGGLASGLEPAEPQERGLETLEIPARQVFLDGSQVALELLVGDRGLRQFAGQLLAHAEPDDAFEGDVKAFVVAAERADAGQAADGEVAGGRAVLRRAILNDSEVTARRLRGG